MKNKFNLYLFIVPYIGILSFFTFNIVAISGYPGYNKCSFFNDADCKSDHYSFSLNFFSELGSIYTNTDDDGPPVNEMGENNIKNTFSMIFFNLSLIIVGIVIIIFYQYFYKFFIFKNDSSNSLKFSLDEIKSNESPKRLKYFTFKLIGEYDSIFNKLRNVLKYFIKIYINRWDIFKLWILYNKEKCNEK